MGALGAGCPDIQKQTWAISDKIQEKSDSKGRKCPEVCARIHPRLLQLAEQNNIWAPHVCCEMADSAIHSA